MARLTVVPGTDSEFVELASVGKGKLFRKQILAMGKSFVHPGDPSAKITVDKEFAETLVKNFKAGYCDTVQFPLVDEKNRHVEDPKRNLGQVVDLTYDDEGVYANIDVRKDPDDIGTTILGASAMMHLNYEDKWTGKKVGPTLLHVAGTNRPYLTNLKPYEEVALSDADTDTEIVVLTPQDESTEDPEMPELELDELLDVLKTQHDIDVVALQEQAQAAENSQPDHKELVSALSSVLAAANPELVSLTNSDDVSVEDVAKAVVELSQENATMRDERASLTSRLETLELSAATSEVEKAVEEGKILPSQKDAMLKLRLKDPEMYADLLPEKSVVSLSEDGVTVHERTPNQTLEDAAGEVERLVKLAQENG